MSLHGALDRVGEDRVAGFDVDPVVAAAAVDPDALSHGRADGDCVVAVQGVDDDGLEIALGRQQRVKAAGSSYCSVAGSKSDGCGFQTRLPSGLRASKSSCDLGGEREVAVVVRQPRDQVMPRQHPAR